MRTPDGQRPQRRVYLLRHGDVAYFPASGPSAQGRRRAAVRRVGDGAAGAARRREPGDPVPALVGRGGYLGKLEQSACCVNVLDVDVRHGHDADWQVRAVNVTPYDPVPAGPRISSVERMAVEYRALRDGRRAAGE